MDGIAKRLGFFLIIGATTIGPISLDLMESSETKSNRRQPPSFISLPSDYENSIPKRPPAIRYDPNYVHAIQTFLAGEISKRLPKTSPESARTIAQNLVFSANRHEQDPILLLAVMIQESGINPTAVGGQGEIGLMQIKITTAAWLAHRRGIPPPTRNDLFDSKINIDFAAEYIRYLQHRFQSGHRFLIAYNRGPSGAKDKHLSAIYSENVLKKYVRLMTTLAAGPQKLWLPSIASL